MAAVNKDGLYSTVEILLMDEPQTVLLDNEYSDYYRISLARMMPYGPVTNPEITFSLGLTKMFFIK